ncbi:MAG TPA: hypothetical protein VKA55_09565, partial [Gammaproteobacteria bacterium]|nr:hypothetical protein [Gammaproteobacteria bacterium]
MGREAGHPGSIDRRGDSFRVRFSVYGERHSFTLPGVSRAEAIDFARTKYRELTKGGRAAVRLQMSELIDRFKKEVLPTLTKGTRRSYKDSLKPIRTYFVHAQVDPLSTRIGADDVRRFLVWRQHHGPHGKLRKKPLSGRTLQK